MLLNPTSESRPCQVTIHYHCSTSGKRFMRELPEALTVECHRYAGGAMLHNTTALLKSLGKELGGRQLVTMSTYLGTVGNLRLHLRCNATPSQFRRDRLRTMLVKYA